MAGTFLHGKSNRKHSILVRKIHSSGFNCGWNVGYNHQSMFRNHNIKLHDSIIVMELNVFLKIHR